jgi:hypothetical protein
MLGYLWLILAMAPLQHPLVRNPQHPRALNIRETAFAHLLRAYLALFLPLSETLSQVKFIILYVGVKLDFSSSEP